MPDVFISYSFRDEAIGLWLRDQLAKMEIATFLAGIGIEGGKEWKPEIFRNMRQSDFVIFLATPSSCVSDAVKYEIGAAIALEKAFVPVMAGIKAERLPKWIQDKQAVDIYDGTKLREVFERISLHVERKRFVAGALTVALVIAGTYVFTRILAQKSI